ncbi:MAG: hypothetical protein RQ715_11415, partial [Methylococcales bacterium]|nr:hypothetical protein [Methylococcales bacterium]
ETLALLPHFTPANASLHEHPRVHLHAADARRFVRADQALYDVVIGDLFHPGRDGGGLLYTVEHFTAIRERLAKAGLYCQWLPLYQMDVELLRDITASFLEVFPDSEAWLAGFDLDYPALALIGYRQTPGNAGSIDRRLAANADLRGQLATAAVRDSVQLLGHFIADAKTLARFADQGRLNTDDLPGVLFAAPRFSHRRALASHQTLADLRRIIGDVAGQQRPKTAQSASTQFHARLTAFITARETYLDTRLEHRQVNDQAIDRYLQAVAISPDFTLAYAEIVQQALHVAPRDISLARRWLTRLDAVRPEISGARRLLARLDHP